MNRRTVTVLNALNRSFYDHNAFQFSTTRKSSWPGWEALLPHLEAAFARSESASILDLGCGNGRFLRWLEERSKRHLKTLGLDSSIPLLAVARRRVASTWIAADVVLAEALPFAPACFDAIVIIGVLHHVPSFELRRALIQSAAHLLRPSGVLALTAWQFADRRRFQKRLEPWNGIAAPPLDSNDLEAGDYLVRWGASPGSGAAPEIRYCHHTTPEELGELTAQLPLETIAEYRADGANTDLNLYRVWRREP